MRYIKIDKNDCGGHDNQTTSYFLNIDGWAIIPDDMYTENFPFGDIEVEEIDGQYYVTSWTPLPIPENEEEPEPPEPPKPSITLAQLVEENKILKAQVEALSEQNDFQEELIVELAEIVYA